MARTGDRHGSLQVLYVVPSLQPLQRYESSKDEKHYVRFDMYWLKVLSM